MPEVTIKIGQRPYTVNCPAGEEPQLQMARAALDAEASTLLAHAGRVPEAQMLLMSGLMLADRTLALEEKLKAAEAALRRKRRLPMIFPQKSKQWSQKLKCPLCRPPYWRASQNWPRARKLRQMIWKRE